jgi:hypothetical protein
LVQYFSKFYWRLFIYAIPINAINPITATKENVLPDNNNAATVPIIPKGITDRTIKVPLNVLNSNIKTPSKPKIVIRMIVPNRKSFPGLLQSRPLPHILRLLENAFDPVALIFRW